MPRTAVPTALRVDKTLIRQVAEFDEIVENAEDFIELMKSSAAKVPAQKQVVALRQRMKAALELTDLRDAAKSIATLVKDAKKAVDAAFRAVGAEIAQRYAAQWGRARGLLVQALVEVGALEPKALRLPFQKEQAELRSRLDRIEQAPVKGMDCLADVEELLPMIEAFLKRLGAAGTAGEWMRAAYLPLVARVRTAVSKVPAERCRKTLLAELDFIEVETNKALMKADTKAASSRAVPQLQHIEKLATRIVAVSPALDRELARLAKRLAQRPEDPAFTKALKALVQAKATTWPAGADPDAIAKAMAAFEADVTKLAAAVEASRQSSPAGA